MGCTINERVASVRIWVGVQALKGLVFFSGLESSEEDRHGSTL